MNSFQLKLIFCIKGEERSSRSRITKPITMRTVAQKRSAISMSAMPPKQHAIHGMPLNDADANKRLLGPKFSGIVKAFGTPKRHRKSQSRNDFQVGRSGNGGRNQQCTSNVNGQRSISPNKKSRRFKRPETPEHELFTEYKGTFASTN